MEAQTLILLAPVSGFTLPIEEVPDPVFAGKMVGDGIAIDPISQCLVAPCDGAVVQIHPSCHALTVAHPSGVEILMHVGLDTVALKGQGFQPRVQVGDQVRAGDPLLAFEADEVASRARSLLTEMVITNGELVARYQPVSGPVEAGRDPVLTLHLVTADEPAQKVVGPSSISAPVVVPNPQGLHARPAAVLANLAKRFRSEVQLVRGDEHVNAKSVVALMTMQVSHGEMVRFRATGEDAEEAVAALAEALSEGLGEEGSAPPAPAAAPVASPPPPPPPTIPEEPGVLRGVGASPGLAVGKVFQLRRQEMEVAEIGGDPAHERRRLDAALEQAKGELEMLQARMTAEADPAKAGIFAAHRELLDDPDLVEVAQAGIAAGKSAGYAWKRAYSAQVERLSTLKNELLAARATDLRDVGERVLRLVVGEKTRRVEMPAETILIAEDLTPSDTATLDRSKVLGFATVLGGATSHVAILARSLDLPALAGMDPRALEIPDGTPVVLDGSKGRLQVAPPEEEMARCKADLARQIEHRKALLETADQPAITRDGHQVEVAANVGSVADAEQAVSLGAEGVGLLRSEFLFMGRATPPSEDEQAEIYAGVARALGPERTLVIRTLDVGGDKPLPYLPIPKEENPFLGERGLRVMLTRPDLMRTQFRAILRAAGLARLMVMLPMVTTVSEFQEARKVFEEERARLDAPQVRLGLMIEVPAAALMAEAFAREADFFSIGTNDLTQYTLAMDRGHPKLAAQVDGLHPAVLRLIDATVKGARRHGRWVGVCGGIAGDVQAVALLVGLGVDELSVAAPAVPAIKARVRELTLAQCQDLARRALDCETPAQVRELTEVPN